MARHPQPRPAEARRALRLAVDRFEAGRDGPDLAVLVLDDGQTFHVPRSVLPAGVGEGDALTLTIEADPEATREAARRARQVRDELKKTDPGGAIQL